MICDFCQKPAILSPLDKNHLVSIYFCHTCQAEYLRVGLLKDKYSTSLYASINNLMYRWTQMDSSALIFFIETPGIPGKTKNQGVKLLQSLNDVEPATPDNIIEKLSNILIFI